MSGGSYDYAQFKLDEWACTLRTRHPNQSHVLALADHLEALGKVMHEIEWADSLDTSWTPEIDAQIRAVLAPAAELAVATARAQAAHRDLSRLLGRPILEYSGFPMPPLTDEILQDWIPPKETPK
jgi:hypothetical protein